MVSSVVGKRVIWGAWLLGLASVLAAVFWFLLAQLHSLSSAERDNVTWTVTQLETELANFQTVLAEARDDPSQAEVRLRGDVVLSRLNLVMSGVVGDTLQSSPTGAELLAPLEGYAQALVTLLDQGGGLTPADTRRLRGLTRDIRPVARDLALHGVELMVATAEARRQDFARTLWRTGMGAVVLVLALAVMVIRLQQARSQGRQADRALSLTNQRLGSTVAASLDAIIIADQTGRVVEFNAAAEGILGWQKAEILGRAMDETIIPAQHRAAHREGMARFLRTGERRVSDAGRIEITALRKDGEEFPVELNITSAQGAQGTEFIAYLRDISDRKAAEQGLIEARDQAQRADRAKSEFLAVMSHEMRTPLNGILGVLDLMRTTPLGRRQEGYVDIATASGEILLEHVNEALDITRIEAGELVLSPQDIDLAELAGGVIAVLSPLAQEKGLALDHAVTVSGPVHGDAGRTRQILFNLVGNAIKFTRTGQVTLRVEDAPRGMIQFTVTDTGPGIAPEDQARIFEDYVMLARPKGDRSRSSVRGDGLGLAIARRVARRMGGELSVHSTPGEGASFLLSLPLPPASNAPRGEATPAPDPAHTVPKQVLVVEDNDTNRRILRDMLTGLGHVVREARDGQEGLELARGSRFDLVFMDISMPVMNGIEATRRLRAAPGPNREVPIIGLTAHGREEYRERAERAGMSAFHVKPIRLAALQGILGSAPGTADDPQPPHALEEALELIGAEKLSHHAELFFDEWQAFLALLRGQAPKPEARAVAEAAHKLKGAAGLLGFEEVQALLQRLDPEAPDLPALEAAGQAARGLLAHVLNRRGPAPKEQADNQ